jgi:ketosteroid isomerase-like protein
VPRATVLERLAASPVIVDEYPVDDTRVDVYGDVAISTGRAVFRGHMVEDGGKQRQIERASRFVHVWVRSNGVWQTVYAQSSHATDT